MYLILIHITFLEVSFIRKKTAVNVDQPDLVNFSNLLNKVNVFPLWKQELAVTTCIKLNQNNVQ